MPFVRTPQGITLYCEAVGDGPPLLFLPGSDTDLRGHPEVTPFVDPLAGMFSMLAYDQRGLGSSPGGATDPTMADFADDVAGVLDTVGWERADVVGYSFGGMVAQEAALRHPGRIRRLVLLCTSSGGAGGASYPLHELHALPDGERQQRFIECWDLRRDRAWRDANPDDYRIALDELERVEAAAAEPRRAKGMTQQLAARRTHDTYDRLPDITAPTLIVGGTHDGVAPTGNQAALESQIPGARLELFDGGHRVLWEDPAARRAIAAFLAGGA